MKLIKKMCIHAKYFFLTGVLKLWKKIKYICRVLSNSVGKFREMALKKKRKIVKNMGLQTI